MPEEKEELPFETYCDLIERELREALKDIAAMRDKSVRSQTTLPKGAAER